jgi:hypothetical protein
MYIAVDLRCCWIELMQKKVDSSVGIHCGRAMTLLHYNHTKSDMLTSQKKSDMLMLGRCGCFPYDIASLQSHEK